MKPLFFLLPALCLTATVTPPQNLNHNHRVMYCPFDVSTSLSLTPESAAIEVTYTNTQEQKNLIVDKSGCLVQHRLGLQAGQMNNAIDMTEVEYEGNGELDTLSVWSSYQYVFADSASGPTRFTQAILSDSTPSIVTNTTKTIPNACCKCDWLLLNMKTIFDLEQMAPGQVVKQKLKLDFFDQCNLPRNTCDDIDIEGNLPPRCIKWVGVQRLLAR